MAAYILPGFSVRSPREAARCKLPLYPPPGPPERLLRTKEIDKGKTKGNPPPVPYSSSADAM